MIRPRTITLRRAVTPIRSSYVRLTHSAPLHTSGKPQAVKSRGRYFRAGGVMLLSGAVLLTLNGPAEEHSTTIESTEPLKNDPLSLLLPQLLMNSTTHLQQASTSSLVRQYIVYLLSSQEFLVSHAENVINTIEWTRDKVPIVGPIVWGTFKFVISHTFYKVFVGAPTAAECESLVQSVSEQNIGCLLNYGAETFGHAAKVSIVEPNIEQNRQAIIAAASFSLENQPKSVTVQPTVVAIKLSGMLTDYSVLKRASQALESSTSYQRGDLSSGVLFPFSPVLSERDILVLQELHDRLRDMCSLAKTSRVRVLVDAEYSYIQPAIDRYVTLLSEEYNKVTITPEGAHLSIPIVYNTYQTYLRATPEKIKIDLQRAEAKGYSFGAKLVRGAYVESERALHAKSGSKDPCIVWETKALTDRCFDSCAALLGERIVKEINEGAEEKGKPITAIVIASHNGRSCQRILDTLRREGMAFNVGDGLCVNNQIRGKISFAQLYGMSDNLTSTLVKLLTPCEPDPIPFVLKYTPFMPVESSMPYFIRRANENHAILKPDLESGRGGAIGERRAVGKELRSRVWQLFGFNMSS